MIFYKVNPSKLLGDNYKIREGGKVKLSTKGRYGLRALIDLAQYSTEAPVSITRYLSAPGSVREVSGTADVHDEEGRAG